MFVRSLSTFTRRFFIALTLGGSLVAPAIAIAQPAPLAVATAAVSGATEGAIAAVKPLKVIEHAVALKVEKRTPQGVAEAFKPEVGALYAWVKVRNMGADSSITMVWKKDGAQKLQATLPVGHAWGWKTWSKKGITAKDAGAWTIEVLDSEKNLIDTIAFTVDANAATVDVGSAQ